MTEKTSSFRYLALMEGISNDQGEMEKDKFQGTARISFKIGDVGI